MIGVVTDWAYREATAQATTMTAHRIVRRGSIVKGVGEGEGGGNGEEEERRRTSLLCACACKINITWFEGF